MATASLLSARGNQRTYRTTNNTVVVLEINDEWTEIVFKTPKGDHIGEFEFKELESGNYKLMRMYTNKSKQGGIGRAALQFFKEVTGGLIYTSPHDGVVRDDGSHLTEDAPGFVAKMIEEGLIEDDAGDDFSESAFLDM